MISFFQKHAAKFVWFIVISFIATLFAGSVFSTLANRDTQKQVRQTTETSIAYFGDKPVDTRRFYFFLDQMLRGFRQPYRSVTPEIIDLIQYDAFTKALHYSVLKEGALSGDAKLSRLEKNKLVNKAVVEFNLLNKKELKKQLKERGIDFDVFMAFQEENYLVQQFTQQLQSGITVSDQDVDYKYTEVKASHILIPLPADEEGRAQAQDYIISLQESLEKGISFADLAKEHSRDNNTKEQLGNLGWVRYGQTVPSFEAVLFETEVGTVSDPVETEFGLHLIQVTDRRDLNRPLDIDYETEKNEILQLKKEQAVKSYLSTQLRNKEIRFDDPLLAGYNARLQGNLTDALAAYQKLSSLQPSSPVPDYQLAKVYLEAGDGDKALDAFKRGAVKMDLNNTLAFSLFFIEWAKVSTSQKERKVLHERAIEAAKEDFTSQDILEKYFNDIKQPINVKKIQRMRSDLEKKVEALKPAAAAENSVPTQSATESAVDDAKQ